MPKKSEQFAIENIVQNMQPRQIHEMKLPACFAQKINAIHRKQLLDWVDKPAAI